MKIDRSKIKKTASETPPECKVLIETIKSCPQELLLDRLRQIKTWTYGKCELFHWADVLDRFDEVLEKACKKENDNKWTLPCDVQGNEKGKEMLLQVLQFTAMLIEHSFSRHLYNSMEHLTMLLSSSDMLVVLAVLNLLYVFSKRSNFITRLSAEKKQGLVVRLTHLAESWGGKENGFGLAQCCQDLPITSFPASATTLHFEFYAENKKEEKGKKNVSNVLSCIHIDNVDKSCELPSVLMEELLSAHNVPPDRQMLLFTHLRLAYCFSRYDCRVQCVQARLQAISILVYSNAIGENASSLLYSGLIEELVDILEIQNQKLIEIKAASLRTLTSIIHLDRHPKINQIIDATGASSYHGFLPVLVRNCIHHMIDPDLEPFPQPFATALFSFLYHLSSYESGGEALVSCGMMESLLKVINWFGDGQEHITFVTRAVRVVDLITNLDMTAFQSHSGLTAFINRLEHEIDICRKEQPFVIRPQPSDSSEALPLSPPPTTSDMETDADSAAVNQGASTSTATQDKPVSGKAPVCFAQRAALLKSMLNFLKKAIPDPAISESVRHLMDGSLPRSLKHIISNAEYYGASLFLQATDVVTVYVFQEPSLLSFLQDNGLTDVVLHALLVKDQVPATREVLASLPNVFSALCLNNRGLQAFVECKPFSRLFKVLLSPDYLPAMRRRRSSDPLGDTASNLGNAMDELMRHQPSLRAEATKAIIKLLEEVCTMGRDPRYICQKPQTASKLDTAPASPSRTGASNDASSDEDEEEDEETGSQRAVSKSGDDAETNAEPQQSASGSQERIPVPLMDYVLNVMKFVEAILSNNTTDDHCREFVSQKGLEPLMSILGLPNLPIDFPVSPSSQAVASVCKAVLTLSHEPQVLKEGLLHLNNVLQQLEPLHSFVQPPGGSVLLQELAKAPNPAEAILSAQATPLLHALSATHAYIMMFVHVCKVGQNDIRSISVSHWGSQLGLKVLSGLSRLYTSLVWESTVLLALCSEDILPQGCDFGKADMDRLIPNDHKLDSDSRDDKSSPSGLTHSTGDIGSNGVSAAMETLSTSESHDPPMETEESTRDSDSKKPEKGKNSPTMQAQMKLIKPLLSASSRLGRALAELFGLLVKLSVGSPVRQRRTQQLPTLPQVPTPAAREVASALAMLLASGLNWSPPPWSPVPKLRLTFLICSVGFTSPMLFDEKKFPYHLMLQKFMSSGGQDALFESFRWALSAGGKVPLSDGLEYTDLPDGTGEFLDAWLMLVEKMVNTKSVFESVHFLPAKPTAATGQANFVPFHPLQYLMYTHKAAFDAVMHLWGKKPLKVYGARMSDSILAILCHIIKGEVVIREKLAKEKKEEVPEKPAASPATTPAAPAPAPSAPAPAAAAATPAPATSSTPVVEDPTVNIQYMMQLTDMGFNQELVMEALVHTNNLEQATEYCLTHPPPLPAAMQVQSLPPAIQALNMDLDEDDEEDRELLQAIVMSLGDNGTSTGEQPGKAKKEPEKKPTMEERERQRNEEPLDKQKLDCFTEDMIPGCMQLVDTLPESVYRVCDLIVVVSTRNGESWRKQVLTKLMAEVADLCMQLRNRAALEDSGNVANLSSQPEATKLAARLHLTSLLFEEMKLPCAQEMEASGVLELLVHLLEITQKGLTMNKEAATPKWVAPILLLLDLYEKMAVASCRKAAVFKLTAECHTWKWFDDRNGRWCNYSASNNKTIDDAYRDGETSVRFTAARRRYIVQFNTMVQVNEETGNRRPVMLSLTGKDDRDSAKKQEGQKEEKPQEDQASKETSAKGAGVPMAEAGPSEKTTVRPEPAVIPGLMPDQITSLIRSLVAMIGLPVDQDTLHATLRLTLRLTREHQHAIQFAELGGCRLLLGLTQASAFQGFTSLAALILRHVLEDSTVLKDTMEKVVRAATGGIGSSLTGVAQGSMGSREMNYVLRVLAPAACREAGIFKSVARANLRVGLPTAPTNRDADEFEARLVSANTPQILQRLQSKAGSVPPTDGPAKEVLQDLLNALCAKYACDKDTSQGEATSSQEGRHVQSLADALQEVVNEVTREISQSHSILRQESAMSMPTQEDDAAPGVQTQSSVNSETAGGGEENGSSSTQAVDPKVKEAEEKKKRPLLPKSMILRLLAELVRSYGGIAHMISQHTFQAGQSELVTQDCNVLAFILDQLLPPCQTAGDKDCAALSRVLLASIAACNHSPEAQATLVNELKGALQRALALPESTDKHARIQALTAIVTTVIESCPTPGQMPNQVFKGQQSIVNNMVRLLLKRGLVTDLARIPHSLDLSSPSIANTVNAALKPLEMLSRIVNQPQTVQSLKNKSKVPAEVSQTEGVVDESAADRTPTAPAGEESNTEQMNINIDDQVRIEDVTETTYQDENDDTVPGGVTVEPDMDSQGQTEVLEDVIDELLQRDRTRNPEDQVIGEIIMRGSNDDGPAAGPGDSEVMIDVELEPGELVSADLQMTSQDISEDEAADHHDNDDNNEHDDLSEADDADVDEDEPEDEDDHGDAEDEDVEEEDDEDDDDEGSDMEGDNDDFQDLEDALFGNQDDNGLFVQLEDIFSSGGQHVMFGGDSTAHIRTYQLPVAVHDGDNGNELAPPAVPPAPSNVMGSHPLLMRQPEPTLGGHVAARVHRVGRQRGTYRYNPGNQTFHVHYTIDGNRQPTPPAILQRLLGPTAAADVLQLTGNMSNGSGHARVLLANDELRFMQNDEDLFDDLMQENCYDGVGSSGILSSIPSALTRWTEEARVLDGDSIHDCITTLKPEIIDELEKQRDLELKERKEKRKKTSNDPGTAKEDKVETSKAAADSNKTEAVSTSQGADQQRMEIGESSTTSSLNGSNTFSATSSGEAAPGDTAPVPVSEASRLASAIVEEVLSSTPITVVTSVHEVTPSAVSTSSAPVLETPHNPIPVQTPAAPVPNRYGTPPRCGQLYQLMMSSSTAASAATTSGEQSEICPTLAMDISTDSSEQSTVVESSVVPSDTSDTPQGAAEEAPARPEEPTAPCLNLYRELVRARAVESQGSEEEQTGVITPEEPSNITSSDAVTVHTSGSEPPSTADAETPPNEQPPGFINENANSSWPPPPVSSSSSTASDTQASTSRGPSGHVATGTGVEVPEGVDPSFLAALPENIRQEVIAEQLRLERLQQRAQQQNQQAGQTGIMEVNPEFLAALPPSIQEEVLAQQRAEQARLSATPTVSDTPVDPASFIASLPSSLRQQVLADMDDSMVAVLPADLAAEAQNLRRDMEDRHRRLMQDRLFAQAGLAGRLGTTYAIRSVHRTGGAPWGWGTQRTGQTASNANTVRIRGRYMLDNEALTCLLVLLFLDDPKLNTNRLHRVLRNLCYHTQTRTWVIRALLSILQRTGECKSVEHSDRPLPDVGASEKQRRKSSLPSSQGETSSIGATCRAGTDAVKSGQLPVWLSISLDAALGCRANVFQIQRSGGKKLASNTNGVVNIHPQASLVVCQHVLDILISLAKSFPSQFLPANRAKEAKCDESEKDSHKNKLKDAAVATEPSASKVGHRCEKREGNSRPESDFWELLVRLDSVSSSKKGKGLQRTHSAPLSDCDGESSSFESSPIGQLMSMLSHPVVRRSQLLTDRLLRLLGLVSIGIPEVTQNSVSTTSTSTTTTTSNPAASSYLSTTILASGVAPPARSETTAPDRQSTEQPAQEAPRADVSETMDVTPAAGETAPSDSQSTEQPAQEAWRADLNETMDISAVIDTQLATSTPVHKSEDVKTKEKEEKEEEAPVLKTQLQLAVEVLTSKSCSEEGLEDATNLLLQLSRANTATRDAVLDLLLSGARELGLRVCAHISVLLEELKSLNARMPSTEEDLPDQDNLATTSQPKGLLSDRFNQGSTLVVSASSKERGRRELQLPSMSQLTGKSSSQQFLLRILKVIMQLREAARLAHKKEQAKKPATVSSFMAGRGQPLLVQGRNWRNAASIAQLATATPSVVPHEVPQPPAPPAASSQEPQPEAGPANSAPAPAVSAAGQTLAQALSLDTSHQDTAMELDQPGPSEGGEDKKSPDEAESELELPRLSDQLQLDELWTTLGECLSELARTSDHHAVLVLQPAVEAFFIVHAGEKEAKPKDGNQQRREDQLAHLNMDVMAPMSPQPSLTMMSSDVSVTSLTSLPTSLPPDTVKFLRFAETHRTVLNQILRQSSTPLVDGPFSVLVDHTRILDFDVKRRYFRQELERLDEGVRREELVVHVKRQHVFEDSFRELHRRSPDEWTHRFYIVFEGEEGQDAGGLLREWYLIISREIFNPNYALFCTSPGDRVTYTINPASHCNSNHLSYFRFVGRIIAKAIFDNKLLECYFTRSFYKHILGVPVKYHDMESEDYSFYQGLVYLLENNVKDLGYDLTFSTEIREFGITESRDLKPNGRNITVTEENKREYVKLVCQMKMTGAIRKQLNAFLEGFYDIIPKRLISIFNEQELELLISGLPTIDIDDLKSNTEYHKYQPGSLQVQWFWRALRSFDQADRARFLQFVTGTSKVPLQGFAHLEGMNGTQKFQIHRDDRCTDRLPAAHTCFNQLDLPAYETYDKLRHMLLLAINECSEGFGLA